MKKFMRFVCVALALATCVLAFASCGTKTEKSYTSENTEYFIGATGPLTGDTSVYGIAVNNGAKIAIEEINAAGGLNGVKFKYEMKDDKSTEEDAAQGYTALYESGMQLSIGSVTSGSALSFATRANEDSVLYMTPSASAASVIAASDYGFRVCFGDPQQGSISANTLTETYKKIGVIYDTSDTYSSGIFEAFEARMKELGKVSGTDYVVRTFDNDNKLNFTTQVDALASAECDVIYLPIYYTEASLIIKAAAAKGFEVPVFGNDGFDGLAGMISESDNIKVSIKYTTPFDVKSDDEAVSSFVKKYTEKYGETPNQFAADGYDAVMILYNAMKEAGINDVTMSAADMSEAVRKVLTGGTFTYSGVTGKNMTWDASGSCNKEPQIVAIQ